jgi:hypothetical protein
VYAGIVFHNFIRTRIYIGSLYGKGGLQKRIVKNHLCQRYRDNEPNKALYIAMSEQGARTFFICLSKYKEIALVGQVLLTESVCCAIFGSLKSPQYQELRFHELPTVDWQHGLNRSDPLQTWKPGFESIGQDICTFRRQRTLDNCLRSGPMLIGQSLCRGIYHFYLFYETFRILKHIAELWKL